MTTQPASLSPELIREFVIAGHGNLPKVQEMLAAEPALLNAAHPWADDDSETALQGAAHVGNEAIAEFLLAQGAPLEICTAAMLGRQAEIEAMLAATPDLIQAKGAHHIPLITHAAYSGNVALVKMLWERGAQQGISGALGAAVSNGDLNLTHWILQNGNPDLSWQNFQGKTLLEIATERGFTEIVAVLREYGL